MKSRKIGEIKEKTSELIPNGGEAFSLETDSGLLVDRHIHHLDLMPRLC